MEPVREARVVDDAWCPTVLEDQELPPIISIFVVEARREHNVFPARVWCNRRTWDSICDWFIAKYPEGHAKIDKMRDLLGTATISTMAFHENPNLEDGMLCTNVPTEKV